MKITAIACLLFLGAISCNTARASDQTTSDNPAFVAKPNIAQAEPFDLSDVRLLDGIFKTYQALDAKFMLSLDPERLLHNFRVTANLPAPGKSYGGWENPSQGIRGHFVGHYLSACAEMYAATGDPIFKDRGTLLVTELGKCQDAIGNGYLSAFPSTSLDQIEKPDGKGSDAPYYAIHKIMAGLLDEYHYCGNQQALAICSKMADYFGDRLGKLAPDQLDYVLYTSNRGSQRRHEFGGMSEVLHNLYAITNKPAYLTLAHLFDRAWFFTPLSMSQDDLSGLHANTHIPYAIGFARQYELTGDASYQHAADFFWTQVTQHHSYVTGSDSRGEVFLAPDVESNGLGDDTAETCNVYNMLKLTEHRFTWKADVATADYYERALYNHILSSIDPDTGMTTYYLSLKPGHFKLYCDPDAFWCCTGTGVENHAKYGAAIYYHHDDTLWVNLFMASQLAWKEQGVSVTQITTFPDTDQTTLTFTLTQPKHLKVLLRDPSWETQGATVSINGQPQTVLAQAGSYIALDRTWQSGDKVTLHLPMNLSLHRSNDNPKVVAVMYGPVVLAGEMGRDGMPDIDESTDWRHFFKLPDPPVSSLTGDSTQLDSWIKPVADQPLCFTTTNAGKPTDVQLKPLYEIHHERYTVYWHFQDSGQTKTASQ